VPIHVPTRPVTVGDRAFVAAALDCYSLPLDVTKSTSVLVFKRRLQKSGLVQTFTGLRRLHCFFIVKRFRSILTLNHFIA